MVYITLNFVNIYGVHYITYIINNQSNESFITYFFIDNLEIIVEPYMKQMGTMLEYINPESYDIIQKQLIQKYQNNEKIFLIINRFDKY